MWKQSGPVPLGLFFNRKAVVAINLSRICRRFDGPSIDWLVHQIWYFWISETSSSTQPLMSQIPSPSLPPPICTHLYYFRSDCRPFLTFFPSKKVLDNNQRMTRPYKFMIEWKGLQPVPSSVDHNPDSAHYQSKTFKSNAQWTWWKAPFDAPITKSFIKWNGQRNIEIFMRKKIIVLPFLKKKFNFLSNRSTDWDEILYR